MLSELLIIMSLLISIFIIVFTITKCFFNKTIQVTKVSQKDKIQDKIVKEFININGSYFSFLQKQLLFLIFSKSGKILYISLLKDRSTLKQKMGQKKNITQFFQLYCKHT